MKCEHVVSRGDRKGQFCGIRTALKIDDTPYCSLHRSARNKDGNAIITKEIFNSDGSKKSIIISSPENRKINEQENVIINTHESDSDPGIQLPLPIEEKEKEEVKSRPYFVVPETLKNNSSVHFEIINLKREIQEMKDDIEEWKQIMYMQVHGQHQPNNSDNNDLNDDDNYQDLDYQDQYYQDDDLDDVEDLPIQHLPPCDSILCLQ